MKSSQLPERRLDSWLKGYQEYTEGTETPPIFHLWVALGTIAGAAQRKIFLDADYYRVYSNLFIILVSPPGKSRKSTALRIGKNLLKKVPDYGHDINFTTQASSMAAVVKQFAAINNAEHQSLTAFSSELGSLLGSKSTEMTDFLTDIYDCEPDWDKQTIARGLEKIEYPWFNLIGATTPQWLGDNLSKTAVEGGFVARTLFVYDETRRRVAFPHLTEAQKKMRKDLIYDLAVIAQTKGEFKFDKDAYAYYEHWYENVLKIDTTDYRLSGFFERKHVHVLKVAMAIRLSEMRANEKLLLTKDSIKAAIGMIEELEPGMKTAFSAVGGNIYSTDLERIKAQISMNGGQSYRQILHANINAVDKKTIDEILSSLVDMGDVERDGALFIQPKGD